MNNQTFTGIEITAQQAEQFLLGELSTAEYQVLLAEYGSEQAIQEAAEMIEFLSVGSIF